MIPLFAGGAPEPLQGPHFESHFMYSTYPNPQCIGILCQQCGTDDPPFVLGLLKVGVGEEEEHLTELKDTKPFTLGSLTIQTLYFILFTLILWYQQGRMTSHSMWSPIFLMVVGFYSTTMAKLKFPSLLFFFFPSTSLTPGGSIYIRLADKLKTTLVTFH